MTHTETHDTAARVAAPGAPVAPPPASSEEGSQQKEGSATEPENGCGRQNQGRAEKEVKGKGASGPREAGRRTARREQGRPDPGIDRAV